MSWLYGAVLKEKILFIISGAKLFLTSKPMGCIQTETEYRHSLKVFFWVTGMYGKPLTSALIFLLAYYTNL